MSDEGMLGCRQANPLLWAPCCVFRFLNILSTVQKNKGFFFSLFTVRYLLNTWKPFFFCDMEFGREFMWLIKKTHAISSKLSENPICSQIGLHFKFRFIIDAAVGSRAGGSGWNVPDCWPVQHLWSRPVTSECYMGVIHMMGGGCLCPHGPTSGERYSLCESLIACTQRLQGLPLPPHNAVKSSAHSVLLSPFLSSRLRTVMASFD